MTTPLVADNGIAGSAVDSVAMSDPSAQTPYVSIVLPCFNEQGHVVMEVERICAAMDTSGYPYELLAFDDASTDGTLARLQEVAPQYPQMRIRSEEHTSELQSLV